MSLSGVWNVHRALSAKWTAAGLDAVFRAEWDSPGDTDHQPLNDTEARPSTPVPFCVFTIEKPVPAGSSTGVGNAATVRKYTRVGVQLQVEAKRNPRTGETGKALAARMLEKVCEALDPGAGLWPFPDGPDRLQRIERAAEWLNRLDQNTWEGGVRYELFVDSTIIRRPS